MREDEVADLYRQYAAAIWRRCARLLRDEHLALDVTQEVFIRCLRHHHELRPGKELLGWLYHVATNLCLNELRRARTQSRHVGSVGVELAEEPEAMVRQQTLQVLRGVDRRTQELAVYVFVDGMTHAEAASASGVSERTVRNCLARFLQHARKLLGIDWSLEKT